MKAFCIAFLLFCLTACAGQNVVEPLPEVERIPPSEAMVSCPDLGQLEDDSFGAVVRKLSEIIGLYRECQSKHEELKDFIER